MSKNMCVIPFYISRVIIGLSTFKVSGYYSSGCGSEERLLIISAIFILSTDGWSELAIHKKNADIFFELTPYILIHLDL
jgi:hypothetical protein